MTLDAIGLGVFTVAGTAKALDYRLNPLAAVLLGVLTGVGGGLLRDVLLAEVAVVLRREIYALASLTGAAVVVAADEAALDGAGVPIAAAALVAVVRLTSVGLGWRAPKPRGVPGSTRAFAAAEGGRINIDSGPPHRAAAGRPGPLAPARRRRRHTALARLSEIAGPTLVHGDQDALVPAENARLIADATPRAALELSPAAGHLYMTDDPRIDHRIHRFLLCHTPERRSTAERLQRARGRREAMRRRQHGPAAVAKRLAAPRVGEANAARVKRAAGLR